MSCPTVASASHIQTKYLDPVFQHGITPTVCLRSGKVDLLQFCVRSVHVAQIEAFKQKSHRWLFTVSMLHKTTWGNASIGLSDLHLTLHCALAVPSDTAGATTRVSGARRLPGALSGGAVVVEMPATQVFVGLPVAQDVKRGAGWDGWQAGLRDLQLLQVGVDRWVGPALTCRRRCLVKEKRRGEGTSDHVRLCTPL